MLLGNDLDNFHNFFHQFLVLWINHVVLSLMSQLVHILLLTMLSFVSTSSLTVFVFPQVLRLQSGCCRCFASRTQAPHSRIIGSKIAHRPSQTCNRPTIDLLRIFSDFTNSFSNSFNSSSRFVRLENHAEFGYLTPFDLTPDLWRSAFTGSIDSARSQPFLLLLLQLLETAESFPKILVCLLLHRAATGSIHQDVSPSIHRDVLHHLLLLLLQPSLTNMF